MKFIKLLLVGLAFSFLYSCDNVTEEIYLNADGSGEYKAYLDIVPSMTLMMTGFMSMDSTKTAEEIAVLISDEIWKDYPEGVVDSINAPTEADLKKMKDNPIAMEFAKKVNIFIKGSREKDFLNYGVQFKFKDMEELNKFMEITNKPDDDESSFALGGTNKNVAVETNFRYKKKCLQRNRTYTTIKEQDAEEIEGLRKMFGHGIARTIVYLPKNVKSVKGNGMTEKTDGKVVFEYNIVEMSLGNVDTDFEIKLEK